ncbi:MAG: hypothetical protein AAF961_10335 [Planctomycetota bacterium]
MNLRSMVKLLLGLAIGLPLLQSLLHWIGGLLTAMGDTAAAAVLANVHTAAGVLWLISLLGLLVLLAVRSLDDDVREPGE